jgi:HlyD family secretion protein
MRHPAPLIPRMPAARLEHGRLVRRRALRGLLGLRELLGPLALLTLAACSGQAQKAPQYEVAAVTRGEILDHVTASGSLSALVSVDVGSQVSGKISHLFADYNSPVKKGQLVAEIDPTVYQAQLLQAQGDLANAQSQVTLKAQNLARKQVLVPQKAASQLDLDQAVAELAGAKATVLIKEAALQQARANLGYCKITAPVDGIVIARKVDEGQTVIAAMSTPVLFTVAQDITKMNITADVSEADIGQVHVGQSVEFGVDAFPTETFHGRVSQVRMSPATTQNVVTYQTLIAVDNPEKKLFPGMTAAVSILVARRPDALKIPNAALRYAPPQDAVFAHPPPRQLERTQQLVYALKSDGKTLEPFIVQVGITDGTSTEGTAGVTEGMRVVTATAHPAVPSAPPPQ